MDMMRKLTNVLRPGADTSSSPYLYSIMDDQTWGTNIARFSKKLRDLPLYKFDSLGFYRPVDDPSGHLVTVYGANVSAAKLEKVHANFTKCYNKANEVINAIYEKEIERNGALDWLQPGSSVSLGMANVPSLTPNFDTEE
jgi:hypothetical protein